MQDSMAVLLREWKRRRDTRPSRRLRPLTPPPVPAPAPRFTLVGISREPSEDELRRADLVSESWELHMLEVEHRLGYRTAMRTE